MEIESPFVKKQKILFVVPLPPPWAGVEQMSRLLIQSELNTAFDVSVLKSNVRDSNAAKGKWDFQGVLKVTWLCGRLCARILCFRPRVVYLTLSQNTAGLFRDTAYIFISTLLGKSVVAHLHGSRLPQFLSSVPE